MRTISSVKTIECLTGTMYTGSVVISLFQKFLCLLVDTYYSFIIWVYQCVFSKGIWIHFDVCIDWRCCRARFEDERDDVIALFLLLHIVLSSSEIILVCFFTFCVAITDKDVVMKQRDFLYFLLLFRYKELFKAVDAFSVGVF